jgi:chromosome segregation protein
VPTLAGARADGQRVPIAGLSEGARDQLYLALRLAALGEFATRADPLPFICDDLLVSFDDVRAGLAPDVLAKAGAELQVILFTHHRHVVDLAKARLQDQVDVITL